jgi:signal transduction histidine kinase
MNVYSLPSLLAFTINFSIAFIILLNNPKSKVNRWFAAFVMAFVLWNLSEILILTTSNFSEAVFGAQVLYRVIFLVPAFFVAIAFNFPVQTSRLANNIFFYVILFALPIILLTLSFPNFKIEIIPLSNNVNGYFYKLKFTSEPLFILQLAITLIYLFWGSLILTRKIPKLRTVKQKNQTLFLLIGFIVIIAYFFIINIFRVYLPSEFSTYFLNTIFVLAINIFFLSILIYFKSFSTQNILRSGIIYSIIYTIILTVYFIVVENLSHALNNLFGINSFFTSAFIILILISLIKPLEAKLQLLLDKIFLRNLEKYRHKFSLFNIELQNYFPPQQLLPKVKNFIKNNFLVENVTCYLKDDKGDYRCTGSQDEIIPAEIIKKYSNFIISMKRAFEIYELDGSKTDPFFLKLLKEKKVEVILPLAFDKELLALLFITKKRYENKFTEDELERLTILSNEVTIALHRNKIFEELQRQKDELFKLEKLAAIGQMTAGIAHEIKNPLNTITLSAQSLKRGKLSAEENTEVLDFIINEVSRLDNLLKDFLKLSRTLEIKYEKVEIGTLFSKAITAMEAKNNNNIKIECDCEKKTVLKTDSNLFYQVLLNLSLNGIDAIIERCKKDNEFNCSNGVLRLSTERKDNKILVKIQDNGIGIPENKLNEIFNPFFTTKEEGTGLGLSIVHNIVTSMGGTITVHSQPGLTQFIISFPIE